MTKIVDGNITSKFNEPRPLSDPGKHIHGAIDIAAKVNTVIQAPESGTVFGFCAFRPKKGLTWGEAPIIHERVFSWVNYFYDTYGGLIVLKSEDFKRTHIITHSYQRQIFKVAFRDLQKYPYEEAAEKRFPLFCWYSDFKYVAEGEMIGYVGNAGYSTGPHVHWEIHNGEFWNEHNKRINPESVI